MVLVVILCIEYAETGSHAFKVNVLFSITALLLIFLPIWVEFTLK